MTSYFLVEWRPSLLVDSALPIVIGVVARDGSSSEVKTIDIVKLNGTVYEPKSDIALAIFQNLDHVLSQNAELGNRGNLTGSPVEFEDIGSLADTANALYECHVPAHLK